MKTLLISILLVLLAGCISIRVNLKDQTIEARSLFKNIELSEVYYEVSQDPNTAVIWLTDYEGLSQNSRIIFNPLTKQFELITENPKTYDGE